MHRESTLPPCKSWDVVIGLGSNMGDRKSLLEGAIEALSHLAHTQQMARSALRESAAVGGPPQGAYLNAAVRIVTEQKPEELLQSLLTIERQFGRTRRIRWGPRTLDLDILWIAGVVICSAGLVVPHPRLLDRAFALEPLVEVAPDAIDPISGKRYAESLATLRG